MDTRYGEFEIIDSDTVVSRSIKMYGEWAQNELVIMSLFIKEGDAVLDVGGFIGTHARAFSEFVGQSGTVTTFEPRGGVFDVLSRNANFSKNKNITCIKAAIGDSTATLQLPVLNLKKDNNFGAESLNNIKTTTASVEEVPVIPLDSLNIEKVNFIKIDVEGLEINVLKGAKNLIQQNSPIIVAEVNDLEAGSPILNWATLSNYKVFGLAELAFNPENYNLEKINIFGNSKECGLILVPSSKEAEFDSILKSNLLPLIKTIDDLALLLMHKPQYYEEVLSKGNVAAILGLMFDTPKSNHVMSELNNILTSKSWKITYPLRVALKLIRKLKG